MAPAVRWPASRCTGCFSRAGSSKSNCSSMSARRSRSLIMIRTAVLIVCDSLSPVRFAGLDLAERAARLARRAGLEHVQIVSDDRPFASAPIAEQVLVLSERVIIERGVITDLLKRGLCEDEQ